MGRGGYREPKGAQPPSGVGRFSKRDEKQKIQTPNVQDNPDMEYGDRKKYEQGQRVAPLAKSPSPRVAPTGGPRPQGGNAQNMMSVLAGLPSARPDEPGTAGLDMGPGPGSEVLNSTPPPEDDRQLILQALANMGNPDAQRMLSSLVDAQRPPDVQPVTLPQLNTPLPEDEGLGDGLPEDDE